MFVDLKHGLRMVVSVRTQFLEYERDGAFVVRKCAMERRVLGIELIGSCLGGGELAGKGLDFGGAGSGYSKSNQSVSIGIFPIFGQGEGG